MHILSKQVYGIIIDHPQLFLLHMDEILPNVVDNNNSIDAPIGCSTIIVNEPGHVSLFASFLIRFNKPTLFGRKHSGTLRMHCQRISTIFISCRRTSFPTNPKGSIRSRKNASLHSVTPVICPDTP